MTNRELKRLEDFANRGRPRPDPKLGSKEAELALQAIDQMDRSIELAEDCQRQLKQLFEERFPLPAALIGAMNYSLLEVRQQIPALREAAKEAGK